MASFLLGDINWGEISTDNFISSQKWGYSFYGQDDWKVTPKLTVSVGLRYELFSPINEGFGRQSNFNFDTLTLDIPKGPDQNTPLPPNFAQAFPNVTVSRGQVSSYLIPWDKMDFAPRIGIAYNIRHKTVIRVGYGIFYGGEENQGGNPNRGESAPFNESPILDRGATQSPWATNHVLHGRHASGLPDERFHAPGAHQLPRSGAGLPELAGTQVESRHSAGVAQANGPGSCVCRQSPGAWAAPAEPEFLSEHSRPLGQLREPGTHNRTSATCSARRPSALGTMPA